MGRSISVKPKSRGQPATGVDPVIGVRLEIDAIGRLDHYAKAEQISRSEAIRRLIELGLQAAEKAKARRKGADR
jgi:hypothetical protein